MPTILLGFLFPWTWGISSQLLQQSAALLLTLDVGSLLSAALVLSQPPCLAHTERKSFLLFFVCLFVFLFYSGPQEIRGCSPMLGRAICFTQFSNKNANHSRKHSYKPRNNIILAIWTILNPVKLIHEINCHRRTFHFITWNI